MSTQRTPDDHPRETGTFEVEAAAVEVIKPSLLDHLVDHDAEDEAWNIANSLAAAGLLARPLPETTTEWAVRGQHTGNVTPQHSEKHARAIANVLPHYDVVRREVTAWTEAAL